MKAIAYAVGSFLFLVFFASGSMAQFQRTFVSGLGSDGNPCTRTAPCRTFAQAVLATNAGGEVIVLDSAGYGTVAITKSVSINAPPGVYAGITVPANTMGVTISVTASDTVILRGITINALPSSGDGINSRNAGTIHVEQCTLNGSQSGTGIQFLGAGYIFVKETIVRGFFLGVNFGGPGGTTLGSIKGVLDSTKLEDNPDAGFTVLQGASALIKNSVISGGGVLGEVAVSSREI